MSPGGRPRKQNPKLKKTITIDREVWEWASKRAESQGIGFATLVEQMLRKLRDSRDSEEK